MEHKHLTYAPIDLAAQIAQAHSPKAGGIVLFSGEVRDHHKGKQVTGISYEAYIPMAEQMMTELISETLLRFNLTYAHALHRLGNVGISECAVLVITAHTHRKHAYEANQYIIDQIKSLLPIWKKELYTDGTYYWGSQ